MKESCPGSQEIRTPFPEGIRCIFCDTDNEIWSDEIEIKCRACDRIIKRDMKDTCLDWCPAARECIGAEKYDRLMKAKEGKDTHL